MEKLLLQSLNESFNFAKQKLSEYKKALPKEYQGFVDTHVTSLDIAYKQLKEQASYYAFKTGDKDSILKSFKIHCNERFLGILAVSQPEHILSYGITFDEYIKPERHR